MRSNIDVRHYAPSPDRFFNGGGGYQVLVETYYLLGFPVYSKELDREDVPHWHYVQQRTLGISSWRSRLLSQYAEILQVRA